MASKETSRNAITEKKQLLYGNIHV